MAFIQRYSAIRKGGIIFVGNTLGLSKYTNANRAGLLGSIGAFISLDTSLKVNDFPNGTTLDYRLNGSAAILNIPTGSGVLYAELVWGGLFRSNATDISAELDNAVTFTTPANAYPVTGDAATRENFVIALENNTVGFYVRSADVTSLVQAAGSGVYSLSSVPALIEAIDSRTNDTNHAGWTLAVVYENPDKAFESLTLWVGGEVVSPLTGVTDITLTGFKTPQTAAPAGRLYVSAGEGDAVIGGDQMLFGQSALTLSNLSGVNNPEYNFFCSQINGGTGALDTSGTFGTRNANAAAGVNTTACRQGYDITSVDLTGKLVSEQVTAFIRFITTNDLYVPNCLALEIDNGAVPDLTVVKTTDKSLAVRGDVVRYTSIVTNSGSLPLSGVVFTDDIPAGTEFIPGSVSIDGLPAPNADPAAGFPLTDMIPNQSVIVIFEVRII